MQKFDLLVIGAGPGGYVAAIRAAQLGMKVAIAEREHLGGICLNWGCIPTKSLLKSAAVLDTIKHAKDYGVEVSAPKVSLASMVEKSREAAAKLGQGVKSLLKKNKVEIIEGEAKLLGNSKVLVGANTYEAKNIIIATGARARVIPGLEFDGSKILSYKEAMIQKDLPKSMAIIGAGAIGIEFASFYNSLGSKVTLIEMQDKILFNEDEEIATIAHKSFEKKGITIITGAKVKGVKKGAQLTLELENKKGLSSLQVEKVIVAAGVVANTENLGLDKTKVKVVDGQVKVDEYLQTDEKGVFAIGDVISAPWLAHKASHEGILCVEFMAGHKVKPIDKTNIPGCIYSDPQVASVGLTEAKARSLGKEIKVGKFPFFANGKAIASGYTEGLVKTIFDAKTGELLGAHMVGPYVSEMINTYVLAKTSELTEQEIIHTIFPHPTLSEMLHESVLDAYGKAIHI